MRRGLGDAGDRAVPAVEHGDVLGDRDLVRGPVERLQVGVVGAAVGVAQLGARELEVRAHLDQRQHAALQAGHALAGARRAPSTRPRLVAEYSQPCGPEKSTSLRAASAGVSRSRASSSSSAQPASLIGALRAEQVVHREAPLRLPIPSEPSWKAPPAPAPSPFQRLRLGLLAVLDDVAGLEQDPLRDLAPRRRAPQQELEVHAEVLELLALGVAHHRERLRVASRPRAAARTSRSPRPPRSATRTDARTSASRAGAPRAARGTGRNPSELLRAVAGLGLPGTLLLYAAGACVPVRVARRDRRARRHRLLGETAWSTVSSYLASAPAIAR